ncbi:hypothetical protein HGI30_14385 [Paenibacillus albicereus]|uniref:Zf-HC2 domain-containing protein n=1 Tax=Paenibacillus albicereus TaxID=2726185 RepID=A0A6H2GZN7_9BACL|nr:hypothetical protein [Paenibacillus albicereus]QJC52636.1 hypothetical protein HGI30_14385 [Paenibacillus albicereus]
MNRHPSTESWTRYAAGLGDVPERLAMERHLESCEGCLNPFMAALAEPAGDGCEVALTSAAEAAKAQSAALERVRGAVLSELARELAREQAPPARPQQRRRSWTRHPAFHYGLAAALTLLLLGSGALGELGRQLEHASAVQPQKPPSISADGRSAPRAEASWSSRVVDRTSRLLNEWQSARYRDGGAS